MEEYFLGDHLYGDDFSLDEIAEWYRDEEEAFGNMIAHDRYKFRYGYHELNIEYGYRHVNGCRSQVLSFGGAYGDELLPIISDVNNIVIIEPSELLRVNDINGRSVEYVKPAISGELPFPDSTFDLVTCFSTLHHIPNVSYVISEFARVVNRDGYVLIREPIVSMGDWRIKRGNLTKRERGIPLKVFRKAVVNSGLKITHESLFGFPPIRLLGGITTKPLYNISFFVKLDRLLCSLFKWNYRYHATTTLEKVRPTSIFYVLQKQNL